MIKVQVADKQDQRKLIGKMRSFADTREAFTLIHERQRKTTILPEMNTYSLMRGALPVITLNTTQGQAEALDEFRAALRG